MLKRVVFHIIFLLLAVLIQPVQGQTSFRVLGGIPHLPAVNPASVTSPSPGMLVYSTVGGYPVMYNGSGWTGLCGTELSGSPVAGSFEVRKGIPYVPVFGSDPAGAVEAGSIFFSGTQKTLKVHDGTGWTRVPQMSGANNFPLNAKFSTSNSLKIARLPVLPADPAPSGLSAGAIYLSAGTKFIRYYNGSVWQDVRCTADIHTLAVSGVTGSRAQTGVSLVNPGGSPVTVQGICWSTAANPELGSSASTSNENLSGFAPGDYPATIYGLTANTTYHVRAYAINASGIVYGEDITFTTREADVPTITTVCPPGNITPIRADGGGDITDWGGARILHRGVFVSSDAAYAAAPYLDPQAYKSDDGSGTGPFPSQLTGLLNNTTYYYQAYAENRIGTAYGPVCTFTTPPPTAPVLSSPTVNITNITDTSATSEVIIINNGGSPVLERGIAYRTAAGSWTYQPSSTVTGSDIGKFFSTLSGLTPGTLYYVRAYALNAIDTAFSAESSFITTSLPTVSTLEIYNYNTLTFRTGNIYSLKGTSARGSFRILSIGASALTEYGLCWSTDPVFTLESVPAAQKTQVPAGNVGDFTHSLTNLSPSTTYYVKAYASNGLGTAYGDVLSFTTPSLPSVSTMAASDPATLLGNMDLTTGGSALSDGGVPVQSKGICWAEGSGLLPDLSGTYVSKGSGLGSFLVTLKNLKGSTQYTVRAYATNGVGTVYGEAVTLTTLPPVVPVVSTSAVYNISGNTATGGGTVSSDGGAFVSRRGICWNTTGNPTVADSWADSGTGKGSFTATLTALSPQVTYYVRAYAQNSAGDIVYGNEIDFTTFTTATVSTVQVIAGSVSSISAQVEGAILTDGGDKVTASGICYSSTNSVPTLKDLRTTGGPGIGNFIHDVKKLLGNTTYYVRAYASNGAGTAYGDPVLSFTTGAPVLPELTTVAATGITGTGAATGGTVLSNGGAPLEGTGVCWSTVSGFDPASQSMGRTAPVAAAGSFSTTLSGLQPGTTYYVRAYAFNSVGTAYGANEISFTTLSLATVSTDAVIAGSVSSTSAQVQGTVASSGGSYVSKNGLCWSTGANPTIADQVSKPQGSGVGPFTAQMEGLKGSTTYYVRAYATNTAGTSYGDPALTITTAPAVAPTLVATLPVVTAPGKAMGGGQILSDGGGNISTRGIYWSTTPGFTPDPASTQKTAATGYGAGSFSAELTDLQPGVIYYIKAYAVSDATGPAYSPEISFKMADLPQVTTLMPLFGVTTVTGQGLVTDDGGAALETTGFVWSKDPITDPALLPAAQRVSGNKAMNFNGKISGLSPETTYYIMAFAGNMMGTGYGQQLSFTTGLASLPAVITSDASNVLATTASAGGNITDNGGTDILERGIVYSTQNGFDGASVQDAAHRVKVSGPATGGSFSITLNGLSKGITYYYRAYAANIVGTVYGEIKSFTTPDIPQVETWAVIDADPAKTLIKGGLINSDGGSKLTAFGLCWSTAPNPTIGLFTKSEYAGGSTGSFIDSLTDVLPVTTYHVRAYATNDIGTAYGADVVYTTPPVLATVTTGTVTVISNSEAKAGGSVSNNGGAAVTERGIVWSTKKGFDPKVDAHSIIAETPLTTGTNFSVDLSGLLPGTSYYVRAYAVNAAGTAYGTQTSFGIAATSPVLNTLDITAIKGVSAAGGGQIVTDGGAALIRTGLCWSSTHENPTIADAHSSASIDSVTFHSSLSGLQPNTRYWVRAYAENNIGIAYGLQKEFITATVPTLTATGPLSDIRSASAIAEGEITNDGRLPITARGFVWSIYNDPLKAGTNKTVDKSSALAEKFSGKLNTGLSPNTHYYVWAYATNEVGTTYASPIDLTTLPVLPPQVITLALDGSKLTGNSAVISAEVTDDGGDPVSTRGVCWSTSPDPVMTLSTRIANGTGVGPFTTTITGLFPKTHYYVRAYAKNTKGTAYSEPDVEFTTPALPPAVSGVSISNITMTQADASATVTSNGGEPVTVRGFIWSTGTTMPVPDASNSVEISDPAAPFTGLVKNLAASSKYYVWAYATNIMGTGYSATATSFSTPTLATVSTTAVSAIMQNSAKSGGNVSNTGGAPVTERGIYWGTTNPPVYDDAHKMIFATTSTTTGSYTLDLTALTKGTDYYVQAYAVNAAGTAYGAVLSFKTLDVPTLTTSMPGGYDPVKGSAPAGGSVTYNGGSAVLERGIVWTADTTITDPALATSISKESPLSTKNPFTVSMTGLTLGNAYRVWAYARNAVGTGYGSSKIYILPTVAPTLSNVVFSGMTGSSADAASKVTADGGKPILERGFVWNTTGAAPDLVTDSAILVPASGSPASFMTDFGTTLAGLKEGPTYFVWAWASNGLTGFSAMNSFKICLPVTVNHVAGNNGAPVSKQVTYQTVSARYTGKDVCWIAQNLGSDRQATAATGGATDNTEASAGWYFQFNRSQGYTFPTANSSVHTPNTPWNTTTYSASEAGDWTAANDPCNLLLGGGWRLPTNTEWTAADAAPQSWGKVVDAYNSDLKLHAAGDIAYYASGAAYTLQGRGSTGYYWSSTSNSNVAYVLELTGTSSSIVTNMAKANGATVRCLRDTIVLSPPSVSSVTATFPPVGGVADLSAQVLIFDQKGGIQERGFIWNTTGTLPVSLEAAENKVVDNSSSGTLISAQLTALTEGPTYYVWAYAADKNGTGFTVTPVSFKICLPVTVNHLAGNNGAPVSKLVTYQAVNVKYSGADACWIAQNLGADRQATAATGGATDNTEASAGWYFQFNRSQGYMFPTLNSSVHTPNTPWNTATYSASEAGDWTAANDPCNLLLGGGWRLPTKTEWTAADGAPQNWAKVTEAYNSDLRLHAAGSIAYNASAGVHTLQGRGSTGYYWSSTSNTNVAFVLELTGTSSSIMTNMAKANGATVRCLRDKIVLSPPSVSGVTATFPPAGGVADLAAQVLIYDQKGGIQERGYIWNTTGTLPASLETAENKVVDNTAGDLINGQLAGLVEGPTYYVWAFATDKNGTGFSATPTSFKICLPVTVTHVAGFNGAPVTKSLTYRTLNLKYLGTDVCWMTQNLGADQQATAVNDATEASAGWYFQFNRSQGYMFPTVNSSVHTPNTTWNTTYQASEAGDWARANDPCNLLLGGGWRLPSRSEWATVIGAPQNWTKATPAFNSDLALHMAGNISYIASGAVYGLQYRGSLGNYWSSTVSGSSGYYLSLTNSGDLSNSVTTVSRVTGASVRCLRDKVELSAPAVSDAIVATMTNNSSDITAVVANAGGELKVERGILWNTSGIRPTALPASQSELSGMYIQDAGMTVGSYTAKMENLAEGTIYYVWAYAKNNQGLVFSSNATTFKLCPSVTVNHIQGNVSPVNKQVTYRAVSTDVSGSLKCWITRNLGASQEAASLADGSEASAGWYWQFNRKQGYEHTGISATATRTPASTAAVWTTAYSSAELGNWAAANDPCTILLGAAWRIPTRDEWTSVINKGAANFATPLNLHYAGRLTNSDGSLQYRGSLTPNHGLYWSSTADGTTANGWTLHMGLQTTYSYSKTYAQPVRCIKD